MKTPDIFHFLHKDRWRSFTLRYVEHGAYVMLEIHIHVKYCFVDSQQWKMAVTKRHRESDCETVTACYQHCSDVYLLYSLFSINKYFCSALEALIRAKYEQKKYIDKDWVAPQLPVC